MNNYETIIGIEVHVELNTKHKIFSPAINDINAQPNTNIHPIDLGFPGALPRFNEEVLRKSIIVCQALNMEITHDMQWDRKNYFYPDNPKGYQITQYRTPIGRNGYIMLDSGKKVRIDFMHMEEDTAKSFHDGATTKLDFNRSGVPLIEIVSHPDLNNAQETIEYLEKLRSTLLYIDASDVKMNEGSFRVDVNISVRPVGYPHLNNKVEIKNLNSFNNIEQAIKLESTAQIHNLNIGRNNFNSTKRFNEQKKQVELLRKKEGTVDYRYIPEPDLPPIKLDAAYINNVLEAMPVLPQVIKKELQTTWQLNDKEVKLLMNNKAMTVFYLALMRDNKLDPRKHYNYLTVNIMELLNKQKLEFSDLKLEKQHFVDLESALTSGDISSNHVKKIIPEIALKGEALAVVIERLNLKQITDPDKLLEIVTVVLDENPETIELYKNGKDRAFGFLVGQGMKRSKGQANPELLNKILKTELEKR